MTEQRKPSEYDQLAHLVECYLGLESMEATFELLELCGATLDVRALPRLKQRLQEEAAQIPLLHQRGYLRMREKCEQLVTYRSQCILGSSWFLVKRWEKLSLLLSSRPLTLGVV